MKDKNKKALKNQITERAIKETIPSFKLKDYWHFDKEILSEKSPRIDKLKAKLLSQESVAKHSFLPFLLSIKVERRLSRKIQYEYYKAMLEAHADNPSIVAVCKDQIESFDEIVVKKTRSLCVAAHTDAHIYDYYTSILIDHYEKAIKDTSLVNEVVAFRKAPSSIRNGVKSRYSNLLAAYDAVQGIKKREHDCFALCFDLSKFFDCIDHNELKKQWCNILGCDVLPPDHYNIFKSITKYTYIDKKELFDHFSKLNKENKNQGKSEIKLHEVFSSAKSFREFRNNFHQFHKNPGTLDKEIPFYGIAQGVSISTVLSNI